MAEAQRTGSIGSGRTVTDADNAASRGFLQMLLGGSGTPASSADVEQLASSAEALPAGAAFMVAQVTMGSRASSNVSPADVAAGLRAMTPAALNALRAELSVMRTR